MCRMLHTGVRCAHASVVCTCARGQYSAKTRAVAAGWWPLTWSRCCITVRRTLPPACSPHILRQYRASRSQRIAGYSSIPYSSTALPATTPGRSCGAAWPTSGPRVPRPCPPSTTTSRVSTTHLYHASSRVPQTTEPVPYTAESVQRSCTTGAGRPHLADQVEEVEVV